MASHTSVGAQKRELGSFGKIALVVKREFIERVRTKWFIISTILVPVFLGAVMFIPMLLSTMSSSEALKIAVVDETGSLYQAIDAALSSEPDEDFIKPKRGSRRGGEAGTEGKIRRFQLQEANAEEGGKDAVIADLTKRVEEKSLDAYLLVPAGILEGKAEPTYYGRTVSDFDSLRRIDRGLTGVIVAKRLSAEGIDPAKAKDLTRRVDLGTLKIGEKGQKSKKGFAQEYLVTMMFVMLLYMNLILYGSALARSLIEEKMNKVIEVLLSSLTPFQLMAGKILGVGAAGLTQFVIWSLAALGFSLYQSSSGAEEMAGLFDPTVLGYFVLFFVMGYFLYAALFCIVGAMCTTEHEAQAAQQPVVMLLVVPLVIALLIVRQPGGAMAVALSHVPFFSPIVMFMRINLLMPPLWEIVINVAAMLVTIIGVVWVAGRIFRVGILMTGKRATIPELVRWLKTA